MLNKIKGFILNKFNIFYGNFFLLSYYGVFLKSLMFFSQFDYFPL